MKKGIMSLFITILLFSFPLFASKKYIFNEFEYRRVVLKLLKTKLKRFENRYFVLNQDVDRNIILGEKNLEFSIFVELGFTVNGEKNEVKLDLLKPPYSLSKEMKNYAEFFLKKHKIITAKTENLFAMRDYFYNNPEPIKYIWNLTLDAEDVYRYRKGNCFSITNYFVGLTRYIGLKSYYYYFPYTRTSYISGDVLITTTHIVCGIDIGNRDIPFVIDYLPDVNISYKNLFKLNKIKKISDIEAAALFYSNWGVKMMLLKNYGTAEFLLLFAEGLNPQSANIKNNLGVLYKNMGDFEKAADCFLKAISLTSNFQKIIANLIKIEKNLPEKKRVKIEKALKKALENNYYWHLNRAKVYMKQKEFKKAYKELKKADKLSPDNQEVYIYFLKFASKTGDKKLYEKYSKKIKKIDAKK